MSLGFILLLKAININYKKPWNVPKILITRLQNIHTIDKNVQSQESSMNSLFTVQTFPLSVRLVQNTATAPIILESAKVVIL